jgi:hypothetical protein
MRVSSSRWIAGLLAACAAACAAPSDLPPGYRSGRAYAWDFEQDGAAGSRPSASAPTGRWEFVNDPTAPSGRVVLAQVAENPTKVFNLWLVDERMAGDGRLAVSFASIAGLEDQGGGLVWRAQDAANYYVCRFNPLERNFRLYVVVAGERRLLESADLDLAEGWHRIEVRVAGTRHECFVDGAKVVEAGDSTLTGAGRIGLWTKADAATRFDDLSVTEWIRASMER